MSGIDLSLFDIAFIEEKHKRRAKKLQNGYADILSDDNVNIYECARPNCQEDALYRAPKSPNQLNEYRYFCLKHVQEHNRRWNFCAEMSENEILSYLEKDIIGHRPTWRSGLGIKTEKKSNEKNTKQDYIFDDPFDLASTIFGTQKKYTKLNPKQDPKFKKIIDACAILGVDFPIEYEILRKSYKKLVKQYHPDINKQDIDAEEKLRKIVAAYKTVTAYLHMS